MLDKIVKASDGLIRHIVKTTGNIKGETITHAAGENDLLFAISCTGER